MFSLGRSTDGVLMSLLAVATPLAGAQDRRLQLRLRAKQERIRFANG